MREGERERERWFIVKATDPYRKVGTFMSTIHDRSTYQQPQSLNRTYHLVFICVRKSFFSELLRHKRHA